MTKHPELRARALISILDQRRTMERAMDRTPASEAGWRLRSQFLDDYAELERVAKREPLRSGPTVFDRHRAVDRMREEARVKKTDHDVVVAELEHEHELRDVVIRARTAASVCSTAHVIARTFAVTWVEALTAIARVLDGRDFQAAIDSVVLDGRVVDGRLVS